jgi:hypothetical protein
MSWSSKWHMPEDRTAVSWFQRKLRGVGWTETMIDNLLNEAAGLGRDLSDATKAKIWFGSFCERNQLAPPIASMLTETFNHGREHGLPQEAVPAAVEFEPKSLVRIDELRAMARNRKSVYYDKDKGPALQAEYLRLLDAGFSSDGSWAEDDNFLLAYAQEVAAKRPPAQQDAASVADVPTDATDGPAGASASGGAAPSTEGNAP